MFERFKFVFQSSIDPKADRYEDANNALDEYGFQSSIDPKADRYIDVPVKLR